MAGQESPSSQITKLRYCQVENTFFPLFPEFLALRFDGLNRLLE